MDHEQVVSKGAVERYVLGELTSTESEEFEIHFFDCAECAQDLRAMAIFAENAKSVFLDRRSAAAEGKTRAGGEPSGRSWWRWMWEGPWRAAPILAAVALLCMAGYQAIVVIPGLRSQLRQAQAPQAMASYVLPSLSRGDERVIEVPRSYRAYILYMDPTWDRSYAGYLCSFVDEAKVTRFSVLLPPPAPNQPLQILMSRSQLPSGRYNVIVHPTGENVQPEAVLDRYLLILKID
jgi:hypothetical protein